MLLIIFRFRALLLPAALAGCAAHPLPPGVGDGASSFDAFWAEPYRQQTSLARALSVEQSTALGLSRDDTIFTASGRTVGFNGQALIPRFHSFKASKLYDGNDSVDDPMDRELRVSVASLQGVFGISEDLMLAVRVPYVKKSLKLTLPDGERLKLDSDGLGDVSVVAKWRFFKRPEPGATTEAAAFLGLELPTGDDDQRDEGMRLPMPLQPGSGSFDPIAGLAFTRLWDGGRWLVNTDLFYKFNTEGNDYEFGDVLRFDIGGQYRLYPRRYERYDQTTVNLVLELNNRYRFRDRIDGDTLDATGGLTTFLSPGLQVILNENMLLEFGLQLPVYRDLNGPQLGEDYGFIAGLRWRF